MLKNPNSADWKAAERQSRIFPNSRQKNITRENQASLTQQILHYCAAHQAALHTHSNQTQTYQTGCMKPGRWRLKLNWWRNRLTEKKGWGGMDARGWVWKRPCIRRISYWSTGGKQPCALRTRVDIRVDMDVCKILGCVITETHSTLQQLRAPESPPWSLYHIL